MIELIWPWALLLLPLPLLARRLKPLQREQTAILVAHPEQLGAASIATKGNARAHWLHLALLWMTWVMLVAAVTRPQWTGDAVPLPTTGRDLLLAVDISGSMNTEDMTLGRHQVNRLTVVKDVVNEFVRRRSGDRVGLIVFGSNAYLHVPLTFDHPTVAQLLGELQVNMAGGKTAVGDAVGLAVRNLRDRPAQQRVLILLTDGANNIGALTPAKAAELARDNQVRIYTIGVGADAYRLPGFFGTDLGARIVNPSADLDEESLNGLAASTGGRYFRARNTEELQQIYAELDKLEPTELDPKTVRPSKALFFWPLSLAFALSTLLAVRVGAAQDKGEL